ncbi:MAG: hypothetical protein QY326_00625 [Bdellovibrionota bacterium]|nr:MAG: hypothetical protein QY326_00625 [Bdellovibrionota bacterium]
MSTPLGTPIRMSLACLALLIALAACQRTNYPAARVDEPESSPPYSVQANPNAAPQEK